VSHGVCFIVAMRQTDVAGCTDLTYDSYVMKLPCSGKPWNTLYIAPNSKMLNGLKTMWKEGDMRYYTSSYVKPLRQTTRI
jgi:hypothetical protein